jgi:hypothetical protein
MCFRLVGGRRRGGVWNLAHNIRLSVVMRRQTLCLLSSDGPLRYSNSIAQIHNHVHKGQSLILILSQMNSVHNFAPEFFKIHLHYPPIEA